jgi:hypothetical protein
MIPSSPVMAQLEAPKAAALKLEHRKRDRPGDDPRRQQRHAEQQVQPERSAQELGDVGRHCHHLGLHPHAPGERARRPGPDVLG